MRRLVAVLPLLLLTGCTGSKDAVDQSSGGSTRYVQGSGGSSFVAAGHRGAAPEIAGETLTGERLDVASFRGKVVVLNVWANWCGPCIKETPFLQGLWADRAADGVQVLGVLTKDTAANGRSFVRKHHVTYPSIVDESGQIPARVRDLPPSAIPSTLVLDREGRVAARFPRSITYSELAAAVDRVLAETS